MKALNLFSIGLLALLFLGCQKPVDQQDLNAATQGISGIAGKKTFEPRTCTLSYDVTLNVDKTSVPGKTVFTWTITNPAPGNGKDCSTLQDLGHWDFVPSQCLTDNWQDVVEASYNSGTGWTLISPLPSIEVDHSLDGSCETGNVFKFDYKTSGSTPTQYRLVLNGNWGTDKLSAYFKSGNFSGCYSKEFADLGIGCKEDICSYSQGYWFANNAMHPNGVHAWANNVTIGGQTYTQAQGLAIWNTPNSSGITDATKAFTQLAALRLSGATDASLEDAIKAIDDWLASFGVPLTPANLRNQTEDEKTTYGDAKAAADKISNWIQLHHCD